MLNAGNSADIDDTKWQDTDGSQSCWLKNKTTPCLKKQAKFFGYNYVKLPPNLTIYGTMMANCLKLYETPSLFDAP